MKFQVFSLQPHTSELKNALLYGTLNSRGETLRVLPQEIVHEAGQIKKVILAGLPLPALEVPSFWRIFFQALHLEKIGLTLFPALVVLFYGVLNQGWSLQSADFLLSILIIFCLQSSMQMMNDVEDHLRLVDLPSSDRRQGRGVIQQGWVSAHQVRLWSWMILSLGIVLGLGLVLRTQNVLNFVLGGVGLIGIFSYSGRPLSLKYKAWGDAFIFFMTGPILSLGLSWVAFQSWSLGVCCLGLFFGWMNWSVFHSRHIQTSEMDRKSGILTLPLVLGFKSSRIILAVLYGLAALSVVSLKVFEGGTSPPLLVLGFAALLPIRQVRRLFSVSGPLSAQLSDFTDSALITHFWVFLWVTLGLFLKF